MAIQNSLDRIFEAMVAQLRDVVAPSSSDPYARSQVLAMAEMLANLQTRVEWRCDQLAEEIRDVRAALGETVTGPAVPDNPALVEERRQILAALAVRMAGPDPDPDLRERVAALVKRRLEVEQGRIRTGMYR